MVTFILPYHKILLDLLVENTDLNTTISPIHLRENLTRTVHLLPWNDFLQNEDVF